MVKIDGKTLIFFEESALAHKYVVPFLEGIFETPNFADVTIYIDESLKQMRRTTAVLDMSADGWVLDGVLDIFESLDNVQYTNTNSYFDFSEIFDIILKKRYLQAYFITQKANVFEIIEEAVQKSDISVGILKFGANGSELWKKQIKNKQDKAFFVDKDKYINQIDVSNIDYVFSPKYHYLKLLQDDVKEGGEGKIYRTYQGMLCKIFHSEHISYINFKKLQHMLNMDIYNSHINWPKDIVYYDNNPVGYVMDEITDAEGLDDLRISGFEGISEQNRYEIAINFLKLMHYLHQKNIVVGDLKLDNILIRKPNEVFMIDCGSYQIDDYPCVVFHPQYTKKQYTEQELRKFLRSPEDEYYAINKIIFEIIIGRTPFFDPDNLDIETEGTDFLYPLNIKTISSQEKRIDLKRWAMMSQKMREMFYYYFTQDKVSYLPEWITEIQSHYNKLKNI